MLVIVIMLIEVTIVFFGESRGDGGVCSTG